MQLGYLFVEFCGGASNIGPVEPNFGGTLLQLLGQRQRRGSTRHTREKVGLVSCVLRFTIRTCRAFGTFSLFDFVPGLDHVTRSGC